MWYNCSMTHQAILRKHCTIVNGARTLSIFLSTVLSPNDGCISHHVKHCKSMSELQSALPRKVNQKFLKCIPRAETRLLNSIHTDVNKGLCDAKSGQETSIGGVEAERFHFHPACQTQTITNVSSSFTLVTNIITQAEEDILMKEVEPHLKRLKYEFDHWDDAIHGFREIERSRWGQQASSILARVYKAAFPDSCQMLPQAHVLDLAKSGVIKPHVDSVRFCGNTICGLSLLSDAVMRLRHVELKDQVVDVLLKRGSLYVMRDESRYNFTHEVLGEEESFFQGETVVRGRRVSIVRRNQPTEQSTIDSATHS